MKSARLAVCAVFGLLSTLVQARPDVHEEVATLPAPTDQAWQYLGRFGVAIDGDWALVSAQRAAASGTGFEAAALLYRRSGTQWTYQGILGSVGLVSEATRPGIAMKHGVAAVAIGGLRIFERNDTGWTEATYTGTGSQQLVGEDVEVDNGRILIPYQAPEYRHFVLRKGTSGWYVEGNLVGHINQYSENPETPKADLEGERAVVLNDEGEYLDPSALRRYRLNENGVGWREETPPIVDPNQYRFGPHVAMSGPVTAFTHTRNFGTRMLYDDRLVVENGVGVLLLPFGMQPVNGFMQPPGPSDTGIERVGELIATRNYDHDSRAHVYNMFRLDTYVPQALIHVFKLQAKNGASLGGWIDSSGNRVIVSGQYQGIGSANLTDNTVRIYELPPPSEIRYVYTLDFEQLNGPNQTLWQVAPGSDFFIKRIGNNGVWRQPSTNGTPSAYTGIGVQGNQGIQAEITPRSFSGTDRWVGLMTRRIDASNYYYVTLRTSGRVALKRMQDGIPTTLASAPATPPRVGTTVRLRLESIGQTHRVHINDRLVLTARDSTFQTGRVGLVMHRAAVDFDNAVWSPSQFATIYADDFTSTTNTAWTPEGAWQRTGGLLRQSSASGYARTFVGSLAEDQYVQARVRPLTFAEPDNWVGLMLYYQDERNYAYLSLRGRGVISLWRRTDGVIQQLGTRAISVTPGSWYTLRAENINRKTRVYVNNALQFTFDGSLAPISQVSDLWPLGRVGLITYKATAEFDDFVAYEP
jgi:hypothetical protein